MKKVISFSLWGNLPKYCKGAIKNVQLAKEIYPGWICRFYCDWGVPISITSDLEDLGAEVVFIPAFGTFESLFWRFSALDDADIVLIRDTDSRFSLRERALVDAWLASDKLIHSIHDHPWHRSFFMPGLSGWRREAVPGMTKRIAAFLDNCEGSRDRYPIEYEFLQDVMPEIEPILLRHDSIYARGQNITIPREGLNFCGRVFDENDHPVLAHDQVLMEWEKRASRNRTAL